MSPITHFFIGWVVFEQRLKSDRDKALVCLAGVVPDLDGLGIVVDFVTRVFGWPETNYYQTYHHLLGHGLPAVLLISLFAAANARQRFRVAAFAFMAFHLHLLCDLFGARGSTAEDIWPIYYFSPISSAMELSWRHQWSLVGWQNMLLSMLLLAAIMVRATARGYSPLGLVSRAGDAVFVAVLRHWRLRVCSVFDR